MLILYAVTLFASATLLFAVQPMVGKMILPLLGGTPAVWSTCMVFFQAALLGGYAYAHASATWLGVSRQALLHVALLLLPLTVLPLGIDAGRLSSAGGNPVLGVLLLLSVSVGLPFFVVSATAPLLQRWFTHTGHRAAVDPYFLYAASNLGSMLALLAYPTLIEPRLHLNGSGWVSQTGLWTLGYGLLAGLIVLCALTAWRGPAPRPAAALGDHAMAPAAALAGTGVTTADFRAIETAAPRAPVIDASRVGAAVMERGGLRAAGMADAVPEWPLATAGLSGLTRRLRWVALAFVPSSLLLGVTTYVTTDIAAVPLLWVLPLAIYLSSFILTFGRWPAALHRVLRAATLPTALLVMFFMVSGYHPRNWVTVLWHFALLLVASVACHGELALDRPQPARLTEFYLLISIGGVLGGLFNALIAPVVFQSLAEYPLAMVLACMLAARGEVWAGSRRTLAVDLLTALGVVVLAAILYSETFTIRVDGAFLTRVFGWSGEAVADRVYPVERFFKNALQYGPPLLACLVLRRRALALGVALAGLLLVAGYVDATNTEEIKRARSFFGVLRVTRDRDEKGYTELRHGTTLHGRQAIEPARRGEPVSYYHRRGPVGRLFADLTGRIPVLQVAVIGLGTGTIAAYARPGDRLTFYEIDPVVRDIALDPQYFTFLSDAAARAAVIRLEMGDARIRLETVRRERPGEQYDLIVVDAFSSDAIPVHLLTREAVRLYLEVLAPGGLLVFHISNRYLELEPVVANLAEDARLGGRLLAEDDSDEEEGSARSTWVALARTPLALGGLAADDQWAASTLSVEPRVGVWTDDFHNLLSVFKWR